MPKVQALYFLFARVPRRKAPERQLSLFNTTGAIIFASLLLAACGSSNSGSSSTPNSPSPPPVFAPVLPTGAAFSASSIEAPPAAAGATSIILPLPPSRGYSGQATFPVASVPANLSMAVTYANKPPTGISAFATQRRPASEQREPLDVLSTDVAYVCVAANKLVDVNGSQFSFTLPRRFSTSLVVYYLAIEQKGRWTAGYGGPGTVATSANSASVAVAGRFGFTIPAEGGVCFALYGRSARAATPVPATPAPSAAPSAVPSATGSATPGVTPTASPTARASSTPTPTKIPPTPTPRPTLNPGATPTPGATATATPTPSPAATPTLGATPSPGATSTPAPTVTLTLFPTSLTFTTTGASQSLTATETNYSSVLTESNTCSAIASVSPASRTGSSGTFNVTSVAAGSCTVTITDSGGRSAAATIGVTTLGVTIQARSKQL